MAPVDTEPGRNTTGSTPGGVSSRKVVVAGSLVGVEVGVAVAVRLEGVTVGAVGAAQLARTKMVHTRSTRLVIIFLYPHI